ncbi:YcxB family protein [Methylopila sp. 73B]|uniref:YcxB family protein n=1 Tax=Methylopila sp. 73B TaxID=1120792 RepID=UPI0012DD4B3F|nr:YcxB family protein [Methylopila sp. 73B]
MTMIRMRPTWQDLNAAMRAHFLNELQRPLMVSLIGALAFLAMATPLIPAEPQHLGSWLVFRYIPLIVLIGVVGSQPLAYFATIPFSARRTFAQQKLMQDEITMTWDAKRNVVQGAHGQSDLAWADHHAWLERGGMVLLYHSDRLFQFVPARAFPSDACRREMIGFLEAAGVPKARTRRKRALAKPA